jgi:hypothetical protein
MTRYALPRSRDAALPSFRTQIARYGYLRGELPEAFFDLPAVPANAVRFEPVDFGFIDVTIILANESDSLHFPPPRPAVVAPEAASDSDATAGGNDLDIPYRTEDFKIIRLHLPHDNNTS